MKGVEFMTLFGDRISALHLHDNTAVYDQDLHLLPYDGAIDMDRAAELLGKSPYGGAVMLEVKNSTAGIDDLDTFYKKAADVARRFAFVAESYRRS